MGSTSILLLTLFILTSAAAAKNDTTKFEVVKEAACSGGKSEGLYIGLPSAMMIKLAADTPKHGGSNGDGYNFNTTMKVLDAEEEGAASCEKGDDKDECGACLGIALTHLTAKCGDKEAGDVELKGCKMSFQKKKKD
ncbi:hypothetical protein LINPERHAP2_LOCUS31928 [Linum perenne]